MSVVPGQRVLHGAIASEDVRRLQNALTKGGLKPGPADGIYGFQTAQAVRRFQKEQGLESDGIVGPETWQRLAREEYGAPLRRRTLRGLLHGATSGEDVLEAQRRLADAGFNPGEIDGVYGPQTARAAHRFQEANGLPADGVVGTTTWSALLPPRSGDVGTFTRVPELVLVWSEEDLEAVRPFEQVASSAGLPWRSYSVERLSPEDVATWLDRLVVVFLSQHSLGVRTEKAPPEGVVSVFFPFNVLVDRASAGELRIVPILLTPVDLTGSPFASLDVYPSDGTTLSDHEAPADVFRELIAPFLAPAPTASTLPGFAADAADGVALFGIGERVQFLASVLTSQSLETPLAIGLFGDWGSGKSFFMRRLQERIRFLADRSAQAGEERKPTLYCSNVRQVTFNAWLYSDGDIWPTFAAQVFRSLTGAARDVLPATAQADHLDDYQKELRTLEARRSEAESKEAELEGRLTEVESELEEKREEITERAGDLGPEAGVVAKLISDVSGVVRRVGGLVRDWRTIKASDLVVLAVPVAVAVAAFFFDWAKILAFLGIVGTVLAFVLASLRYVERSRLLRSQIAELEAERTTLKTELQARKRERKEAEETLGAATELPLLPQFAEEQALRWLERQQLGVITEIRLAFERLSELIEENRATGDRGEASEPTLPIDRVIIYVDDLDRCSHDVVVKVLETIKVLLDLRHFVVVVGVDSRWLFRSIQVHFSELLHAEDGSDPDAAWAATPQNYLEKIFQYSIVLRPLEQGGFDELIESLFRVDGSGDDHPSGTPSHTLPEGDAEDHPTEPVETQTADEPPADVESTPAAESGGGASGVDLTPGSLDVSREEVEFMKRLAPLFATPRAAKRLANVYRLIRVSAGDARLSDPGGYEPVLLLLAVSIAFPGLAGELFQAVRERPNSSFSELLGTLPPASDPPRSAGEAAQWDRLMRSLTAISDAGLADRPLESFVPWLPIVAEFSFHPWQELLPAETRS